MDAIYSNINMKNQYKKNLHDALPLHQGSSQWTRSWKTQDKSAFDPDWLCGDLEKNAQPHIKTALTLIYLGELNNFQCSNHTHPGSQDGTWNTPTFDLCQVNHLASLDGSVPSTGYHGFGVENNGGWVVDTVELI